MAIHPCNECKAPISSTARTCVKCGSIDPHGHKSVKRKNELGVLLVSSVIMMLLALAYYFGWLSDPTLDALFGPGR